MHVDRAKSSRDMAKSPCESVPECSVVYISNKGSLETTSDHSGPWGSDSAINGAPFAVERVRGRPRRH